MQIITFFNKHFKGKTSLITISVHVHVVLTKLGGQPVKTRMRLKTFVFQTQ